MDTQSVLNSAKAHLEGLSGHVFDLLSISKPVSPEAAVNLAKVISKLSPLLGNLIEFNAVEFLNDRKDFVKYGKWKRQDPGFPDTVFEGDIHPTPGFEIKAWFPLATEITARFRDSQNNFIQDQTYVCLLAWLPDKLIYGKPRILDVSIVSGLSIAKARDRHYHNPPDYLVLEPEDTSARTSNLQQTNTNGHKWQGTRSQFAEAEKLVKSWGPEGCVYEPSVEYQKKLRELITLFPYRLDTNFAKMDRVAHGEVEKFKSRVLNTNYCGMKILDWAKLLCSDDNNTTKLALKNKLDITEIDTEKILR